MQYPQAEQDVVSTHTTICHPVCRTDTLSHGVVPV
jgi:hypothetical protein